MSLWGVGESPGSPQPVSGSVEPSGICPGISIGRFGSGCWRRPAAMPGSYAGMAELADAPDLGSGGLSCAGSIPVARTNKSAYSNFIYGINF